MDFLSIILLLWILFNASCSSGRGRASNSLSETGGAMSATSEGLGQQSQQRENAAMLKIVAPTADTKIVLNSPIEVAVAWENGEEIDSVVFYYNGSSYFSTKVLYAESNDSVRRVVAVVPEVANSRTGYNNIGVEAYSGGEVVETVLCKVEVYSDTPPLLQGFEVVNSYAHDRRAFTQGLVVDSGTMYEGTGLNGESSLRVVEVESGRVVKQHNLPNRYFGEGIAVLGEKLYQLTWQNREGFIYNKESFEQIGTFRYNSEGWGLTTNGSELILSDGSNILYFLDPVSFSVLRYIEVCDNVKAVDQLNELEYIDGAIWANIWYSDLIAQIDPSSGKVLGYIDLSGIATPYGIDSSNDVLNGIAFDATQNRIYVTGKNWNRLFEITVK